eukprot:6296283-Pyramimonas_sp.AAC.1
MGRFDGVSTRLRRIETHFEPRRRAVDAPSARRRSVVYCTHNPYIPSTACRRRAVEVPSKR